MLETTTAVLHASDTLPHVVAQLWDAAGCKNHRGAGACVGDGLAPTVSDVVGVREAVRVKVTEAVCDAVPVRLRVCEAVAVVEAVPLGEAPSLIVADGLGEGCAQ